MTSRKLMFAVLQQLVELASSGKRANVRLVAEGVGVRLGHAARALSALHDAGLIDAERLSLTFTGLALAVALRSQEKTLPLAA